MAKGSEQGLAAVIEEDLERHLDGDRGGVGRSTADVPAAEALEIGEILRAAEPAPRGSRRFEQIQMVTHEPDDARREEAVEQIGPYLGVSPRV